MSRPYVTVSYAQSLDGRIATASGDSQWIGGPESLTFAHELRRDNDAILVGVGTVLKDNPRLTSRIPGGKNPIRVVLDRHLRTPLESHLVTDKAALTWIVTSTAAPAGRSEALMSQGVRVVMVDNDLGGLLDWLGSQRVATLFVEGGAAVITSFLSMALVDRLVVVSAPFVIGAGVEAIGDLGARVLTEVKRPLRGRWFELGQDMAAELIYRELS